MNRFKSVLKVFSVILIILLIGAAIYIFDLLSSDELQVLKDEQNQKLINGLIIGYDAGADGTPRPDTIFLASADLAGNGIGIVSLPRDTRVEIPGYSQKLKLNSAYALGGTDLFVETVEKLLKIPVHFYVELDFYGFERIIDTLGGVELEVQKRMEYTDEAGDLHIDLEPGLQVLDGEKALQFVRYREPVQADIGRIERQQQFMSALIEQAFSMDIIPKIPRLLNDFSQLFQSDLPFRDMVRLAQIAGDFSLDRIEMTILPGAPEYINGVSYWIPNEDGLEMLTISMLKTKDYLENVRYQVDILNGCGIQGLAGKRGELLELWGFNVRRLGNAQHFNYDYTSIAYGPGGREGALRISSLIGGTPQKNEELGAKELEIVLGSDQENIEKGGAF